MRFASACVHPQFDDGVTTLTGNTQEGVGEQIAKAVSDERLTEELYGLSMLRRSLIQKHLAKVSARSWPPGSAGSRVWARRHHVATHWEDGCGLRNLCVVSRRVLVTKPPQMRLGDSPQPRRVRAAGITGRCHSPLGFRGLEQKLMILLCAAGCRAYRATCRLARWLSSQPVFQVGAARRGPLHRDSIAFRPCSTGC